MIHHNIQQDIKVGRFTLPTNITKKQFSNMVYVNSIKQLEKQKAKCGLTEIGLTYKRQWNEFSFERINNLLPHFEQDGSMPNCIFICRVLNVPRQLSKKMILEYFLQQILVEVPANVRLRAQAMIDTLL